VFERVGSFLFSFNAGSFFQNNNSILVPLTEYVKEAIFPPGSTAKRPTHLVDTYCGSGLFGITLSPEFERVAGVEISGDSIIWAKKNAEMNGLKDKTTWLCGKAEDIFGGLPAAGFAGDHSCVVIDVRHVIATTTDPLSLPARDAIRRSSSSSSHSSPSRPSTSHVMSTPRPATLDGSSPSRSVAVRANGVTCWRAFAVSIFSLR